MVEEIQALAPDVLEAAAHAKMMTSEEIEETIDYLLNEVLSSSTVVVDSSLIFRIERSMGKILLVFTAPDESLRSNLIGFPVKFFPPGVINAAKRYRFDEELKNDRIEYQRIYEELKVEAALLVIVCISVPLA